MLSKEKDLEAAPVESLSKDENFALTGYFNDGRKRIDIVLVFRDDVSAYRKDVCYTFLMNIIQFGLEAEIESGKMPEHNNLIFVKVHAPDAIIEECGIYFNEKSWFKDSHLEFINPIFNIFGVWNERELIKIARTQYPGPSNYSTLERSNIVYKILLQLPFGKYKNHFGINKLVENCIVQDAFALHDGPYFTVPKQSDVNMNARQVLFLEWLGVVNIWKMQPIHMIHEYFGKRVSYYFAFYEYFNFMLMIPLIFGGITALYLIKHKNEKELFYSLHNYCEENREFICPECRNLSLCPILKPFGYCSETRLLEKIDKKETYEFGIYLVIWGIFFLIPWRYRERYLSWIWEESRKHTDQLVTPEYEEGQIKTNKGKGPEKKIISKISGWLFKFFIYILQLICLVLWAFLVFRFSIFIWHYPRWKRFHGATEHYGLKIKENEHLAIGSGIYTIIVYFCKMGLMVLAQNITRNENNKTFLTYTRSIATKMYAISFIGSFTILIMYIFLGATELHLKHYHMFQKYHFMSGFGMMNSGLGSSLDDISITVLVITTLEYGIFKMPGFFMRGKTDYPVGFDSRVPCWEREYKLKPLTEFFFHERYNTLAMQFAIITCFSMMFPMASLFLFIINLWDMRYIARQLLLEYRRPLLINTSGPGFWKLLILITALYASFSIIIIEVFQSQTFAHNTFTLISVQFIEEGPFNVVMGATSVVGLSLFETMEGRALRMKEELLCPGWLACQLFTNFDNNEYYNLNVTKNDYNAMEKMVKKTYSMPNSCLMRRFTNLRTPMLALERQLRNILVYMAFAPALALFLFYVIPRTSNSLEDAIKMEQQIKNKYQTRRACALLNE